jgi:cell division protein FtsB
MNDRVNSPKHYTSHPSGVECIEVTQHYNFTIGNAIKYLWRQGLKDEANIDPVTKQVEDLKKAVWYINREITNLQEGTYNGTHKEQNEGMAEERNRSQLTFPFYGYGEVCYTTSGGPICERGFQFPADPTYRWPN